MQTTATPPGTGAVSGKLLYAAEAASASTQPSATQASRRCMSFLSFTTGYSAPNSGLFARSRSLGTGCKMVEETRGARSEREK